MHISALNSVTVIIMFNATLLYYCIGGYHGYFSLGAFCKQYYPRMINKSWVGRSDMEEEWVECRPYCCWDIGKNTVQNPLFYIVF